MKTRKQLAIIGASKTVIIENCGDCPLCARNVYWCKHPDGDFETTSVHSVNSNCPLQDAEEKDTLVNGPNQPDILPQGASDFIGNRFGKTS